MKKTYKKDNKVSKKRKYNKTKIRTKKKINRKKRKVKTKKQKTKKQKGGFPIIPLIGGIAAIAAGAVAAFTGYKYSNMIKERDLIEMLLNNSGNIEYLPKYSVISYKMMENKTLDKSYIERYLKCVSNSEFIEMIKDNPKLLRTITIPKILKNITSIDPSLSQIHQMLSSDIGQEYNKKMTIDTVELSITNDRLLKELSIYLLASAQFTKSPEIEDKDKNKLAKSDVNWIDIIFDGGSNYDPEFDTAVEKLLEQRDSIEFIKPKIHKLLKKLKKDNNLIYSINKKMGDCARKPRGFMEYIQNNISWDNDEKCLACPDENCLIYIYDYYYGFLNQMNEIHTLDKIYILMLCEARICILSKCIILEALRQQSGDKSKVKEILNLIYKRDKSNPNFMKANIPEEYSSFTFDKQPTDNQDEGIIIPDNSNDYKKPTLTLDDLNEDIQEETDEDIEYENEKNKKEIELENEIKKLKKEIKGKTNKKKKKKKKKKQSGGYDPLDEIYTNSIENPLPEVDQMYDQDLKSDEYLDQNPDLTPDSGYLDSQDPQDPGFIPDTEYLDQNPDLTPDPGYLDSQDPQDPGFTPDTEYLDYQDKDSTTNPEYLTPQTPELSPENSKVEDQSPEEPPPEVDDFPKINKKITDDLIRDLIQYLESINQERQIEVLEDFNKMVKNEVTNIQLSKRNINLVETTLEKLKESIQLLFPYLENIFVSYKKYIENSDLIEDFKTYFDFYKNYMKLFSFISPRTIGIHFFELDETDGNDGENYWNYDMRKMSEKIYDIIKDKNTQEKINLPITHMTAMCLLLSRSPKNVSVTKVKKEVEKEKTDSEKLDSFVSENVQREADKKQLETERSPVDLSVDFNPELDQSQITNLMTETVESPGIDLDTSDDFFRSSENLVEGQKESELDRQMNESNLSEQLPEESPEELPRPEENPENVDGEYDWLMKKSEDEIKNRVSNFSLNDIEGAYDYLSDQSSKTDELLSGNLPPGDLPPSDLPPSDLPPSDLPPSDLPPSDLPSSDLQMGGDPEFGVPGSGETVSGASVSGSSVSGAPVSGSLETRSSDPELPKSESSEIVSPTVNIANFDYFTSSYNSSYILTNIIKAIVEIYTDSKTYLVPEFLLFMCKSDNSKYDVIINLFRNDDNFMDELDSDLEVYKILSDMNVEKEIKELEEVDEDDEIDEEVQQEKFEITGYAENKCKEQENKLNNLIKHGGPFTKQDALYLEYCKGRKKKQTLKKDNKTKQEEDKTE